MEVVKHWFLKEMRDFPWREERSPYRVWVSEVMLQQTRAEVVIDYFNRWMEKFPTLEALAKAESKEVIKAWEGLGYYSRARNLHKGAQVVLKEYGGELPSSFDRLIKIPGIGPYTAGAIASFAFKQKAPALDGNVMRVLSRFLAFEQDPHKKSKELRAKLVDLLPDESPEIVMEGLIELGATLCKKRPLCSICPLNSSCKAHALQREEEFPIQKKEREKETIYRFVACIEAEGHFLLIQRGEKEVMEGLFEFPYVPCTEDPYLEECQTRLEALLGVKLVPKAPLKREKHTFTRFTSHLFPFYFTLPTLKEMGGYEWVLPSDFGKIPFSSGHKRISQRLLD